MGEGTERVVWRRHRGTLDATRVAAMHASSSVVLAYDLREKYRHDQIMAGEDDVRSLAPAWLVAFLNTGGCPSCPDSAPEVCPPGG